MLQSAKEIFKFHHLGCDDVSLHVAEIGGGRPIIFLHGFPEHWRAFEPMVTALAPRFRCIAPDQRGYGKSDRPLDPTSYVIDRLCDDVACVVTNLGLEKAHIVAHDWGGLVAWHFAGQHPNLLDRLVVFNAPHPFCLQAALDKDPAQRRASLYAQQFSQPNAYQDFATRDQNALWSAFFGADEAAGWMSASDKAAILANWDQPDAWRTMLNWYRAAGFDYGGDAQIVRTPPPTLIAPALLVWGQQDPLFAPSVLPLHRDLMPSLRIEVMPDGGHSVFRQFPEHCADLVSDFLTP